MSSSQSNSTYQEALQKAHQYCGFRDRTEKEVRHRLDRWEVPPETADKIIKELVAKNYINEERFARSFAPGKFRHNKWGRIKIRKAMEEKGLEDPDIQKGLAEIDEEEYRHQLDKLITRKWRQTDAPDRFQKKGKVAQYVIRKGYEPDLVWEVLEQL